ncbi:MAG: Ig-like domain-containing protein [Defluviitaleaceae bacterium]|nr:Ig-like domain-containing protein [Defluviitaleaceae bacterium]
MRMKRILSAVLVFVLAFSSAANFTAVTVQAAEVDYAFAAPDDSYPDAEYEAVYDAYEDEAAYDGYSDDAVHDGQDDDAAYDDEITYDEYEDVSAMFGEIAPLNFVFGPYSYRDAVFRLYGARGLELDGRARYPHVYYPTVVLGDVADMMGAATNQIYGVRIYARYHHASVRGHVALGSHIFNFGNSPYTQGNYDNEFYRLGGPGAWHSIAYLQLLNTSPLFPTGTEPSTFSVNVSNERVRLTGFSFLDAAGEVIPSPNPPITLESVNITRDSFSVIPGYTTYLRADVAPLIAVNRGINWSSTDTSVVYITNWNGRMETRNPGTATIRATNGATGLFDEITITVLGNETTFAGPQFPLNPPNGTELYFGGSAARTITFANAFEYLGSNALNVTGIRVYFRNRAYGYISPVAALANSPQRLRYSGAITAQGGRYFFIYQMGTPLFTEADVFNGNAAFRIDYTGGRTAILGYTFINQNGGAVLPATDTDPVTGVTIAQDEPIVVRAGQTTTLTANVAPISAGNRNVIWSSGNTDIATVSAAGVVTGVSGGAATITVETVDGGFTDSITVTVDAPIFPVNPPMAFGSGDAHPGLNDFVFGTVGDLMGTAAAQVTGVRLYAEWLYGGTTGQVRLGGTFDHHVGGGDGRIPWVRETPVNRTEGTLTIQTNAVVPANSDFGIEDMWWGSFRVTGFSFINAAGNAIPSALGPVVVTDIDIEQSNFNLFVGGTRQLTAAVLPILAPNRAVTWTSSDPAVATVSDTGLVTGVSFDAIAGESTVTITATTVNGLTDTVDVTVRYGQPLASPQFPVNPAMYIGMGTTAHPGISPVTIGMVADLVSPQVLEQVAGIRLYALYPVYGGAVGQFTMGTNTRSFGGNPGYAPWDRSTQATDGFGTLTLQWDAPLFANGEPNNFGVSAMWHGFFRLSGFSFLDEDGYVLPALLGALDVTSVAIEQPATITMMPTGTRQLSALVLPVLAPDRSVTWTSSNPAAASVSSTGLVTAHDLGTAIVTVRTANDLTDTIEITVVEGVILPGPQFPANYVRNYGMNPRQLSFADAGAYLGENALQVTGLRVYVTNRYPGFDGAIAPVNPDGSGPSGSDRGMRVNSGVFQTEGGNQFFVYQNYEPLFDLAAVVTDRAYFRMDFFWRYLTIVGYTFINEFGGVVLPAPDLGPQPVASVLIHDDDFGLTEGGFADIVGIVLPLAAGNRAITWTSSNPNVATIASTGAATARVTAVNTGTTTITVTTAEGSFTDSIVVTVSAQEFTYATGVFTPVPPIQLHDLPSANDEFIFNVGRMLGANALQVAGVRMYTTRGGIGSFGGTISYGQRHTFIAPGNYGPHADRYGTAGGTYIVNGILPFSRNYTFYTQADLDNDAALFFIEFFWGSSHHLQIDGIVFLDINGNPLSPYFPQTTVTAVNVSPATATVQRGQGRQFTAAVVGTGNPAQTVTWSVEGSTNAGTTISTAGLLNVAANETATTLTVRATSTVDTGISGTASVTVTTPQIVDPPIITPPRTPNRTTNARFDRTTTRVRPPAGGGENDVELPGLGNVEVPAPEEPQAEAPATQIRLVIGSTEYTKNGVVHQSEAAPFICPVYNRTMVPLRLIAEALDARVAWVAEVRMVIIVTDEAILTLFVDAPLPDGMGMPMIVNDRTFVPLAYVSQMLGAQVSWDSEALAVYIN